MAELTISWQIVSALVSVIGLGGTATGLIFTGIGLMRSAKIARNDFMLKFLDRILRYDQLHLRLKQGWAEGPVSPDEWNEVKRYMGLFEGLFQISRDGAYPIERVDNDYSHRVIAIVLNRAIREECLRKEWDPGWKDFVSLWRKLERCPVYKQIADNLREADGTVVPEASQVCPDRIRKFSDRAAQPA
jgi:hypothetical protein